MKTVRKRAWWNGFACGLASAALLLTSAGWLAAHEYRAAAPAGGRFDRAAFSQALDTILDRYVDPVDEAAVLQRGLRHMVAGLDEHSHFLTAAERNALRSRARDGASGLTVHLQRDAEPPRIDVVGVLPGSPAAKAGLHPGDTLLEIDGHRPHEAHSQIVVDGWLSGRAGQTRALKTKPHSGGEPTEVRLRLAKREVAVVAGQLVAVTTADGTAGQAARICIRAFRSGTGERFRKTLARLRRSAGPQGLAALVIDLRGNPGGQVDEALVVADLFVEQGILTRTRGRNGRVLREERAHAAGTDTTLPIVIVHDRHTASAAELLTAALRDNGRARSVGEPTYGKGTVQEIMGLADGSVLSLTIARYYSPNDRPIDGVGLSPDHPLTTEAQRAKPITAALATVALSRE